MVSDKELLMRLPNLKSHFNVDIIIGTGTFGSVYLASSTNPSDKKRYAIKHITAFLLPNKICRELNLLKQIGGSNNVVSLLGYYRNAVGIAFVMPYFKSFSFQDYLPAFTIDETKMYMKNLMIALEHVHSFNVIHRDIKPPNFLFNFEENRFLLIDFGLAIDADSLYEEKTETLKKKKAIMSKRCDCYGKEQVCNNCLSICYGARAAGTAGYKAPEVLLKQIKQTTAVDIWAAGVIMLTIMSKSDPFFKFNGDTSNVLEIMYLCGTEAIMSLAAKLNHTVVSNINHPGNDIREMCEKSNKLRRNCFPDEAYDLLSGLLVVDPDQRLSAKQALQHQFFKN